MGDRAPFVAERAARLVRAGVAARGEADLPVEGGYEGPGRGEADARRDPTHCLPVGEVRQRHAQPGPALGRQRAAKGRLRPGKAEPGAPGQRGACTSSGWRSQTRAMDRTPDTGAPLLTIGDLAERTGLPVRTIRYWSEVGVVPEATRSAGGHRLYDAAGLARLELVATLRELGLGHAEVRRVPARESTVAEVAATHVAALDTQIRTLRLRRAVLSAIATGDREEPAQMDRLNRMARLSAQERQQIIDEFVAQVCEGLDLDPQLRDRLRGGGHRLPDAPTQEQLDAWLELSELMLDPEFQQVVRRALTRSKPVPEGAPDPGRAFAERLDRTVGVALREGVPPESPGAAAIVNPSCSATRAPNAVRPRGPGCGPGWTPVSTDGWRTTGGCSRYSRTSSRRPRGPPPTPGWPPPSTQPPPSTRTPPPTRTPPRARRAEPRAGRGPDRREPRRRTGPGNGHGRPGARAVRRSAHDRFDRPRSSPPVRPHIPPVTKPRSAHHPGGGCPIMAGADPRTEALSSMSHTCCD